MFPLLNVFCSYNFSVLLIGTLVSYHDLLFMSLLWPPWNTLSAYSGVIWLLAEKYCFRQLSGPLLKTKDCIISVVSWRLHACKLLNATHKTKQHNSWQGKTLNKSQTLILHMHWYYLAKANNQKYSPAYFFILLFIVWYILWFRFKMKCLMSSLTETITIHPGIIFWNHILET